MAGHSLGGVLSVVEQSVADLAVPVEVTGGRVSGVVPRVRAWLLSPAASETDRDHMWRALIDYAQHCGQWLMPVGMALPGLRRAAARVIASGARDRGDVEADLVAGFLDAAAKAVPCGRLCSRLVATAQTAAVRSVRAEQVYRQVVETVEAGFRIGRPRTGHPDEVLVEAISAGVISASEATLISVTRLDSVQVKQWAEYQKVGLSAALMRRRRAERRLIDWLLTGRG